MSCCTLAQTCRGSSICKYIVITELLCYCPVISDNKRQNLQRSVALTTSGESYLRPPGWRAPRRSERRPRPRTAGWPLSLNKALSPAGNWRLRCDKSPENHIQRMTGSSLLLGRTSQGMPRLQPWPPTRLRCAVEELLLLAKRNQTRLGSFGSQQRYLRRNWWEEPIVMTSSETVRKKRDGGGPFKLFFDTRRL